ncbi:MAG: PQQ-dependent sugar dehydrogenase [Planctomycetota bacterium]
MADPLPPVDPGDFRVKLVPWVGGIPVTPWSNTSNTFYFGPTDVALIPGQSGRSVVTAWGGTATLVQSDGQTLAANFLDLSDPGSPTFNPHLYNLRRSGMTSIAFHPGFSDSSSPGYRRFYTLQPELSSAPGVVDFAQSVGGNANHNHDVVYEYTLTNPDDLICDATCNATRRQVMRVQQPGFHHNLGDLIFDDAGYLYISSGDGNVVGDVSSPTVAENSQALDTIFGNILRIDPLGSDSANGQYGIPASNPFVGDANALPEIYAYGLRNPYRLDFDNQTGELYASDTGQLEIESVEKVEPGRNYGWPFKEGSFVYDLGSQSVSPDTDDLAGQLNLTDPILEYDHDEGTAVIGGVLYRGNEFAGLQGKYIFADHGGSGFSRGKLFYGDPETGERFELQLDSSGEAMQARVFSVNENADGELLLVGLTTWGATSEGVVYRLVLPTSNTGDFNEDGNYDCTDIDRLTREIASGENGTVYDLTGDGRVNGDDLDQWLVEAGEARFGPGRSYLVGDANLDGAVDTSDFNIWNANKFMPTPEWCSADFNASGEVDVSDFNLWNVHKFQLSDSSAVPEPSLPVGLLSLLAFLLFTTRNRPRISMKMANDRIDLK